MISQDIYLKTQGIFHKSFKKKTHFLTASARGPQQPKSSSAYHAMGALMAHHQVDNRYLSANW